MQRRRSKVFGSLAWLLLLALAAAGCARANSGQGGSATDPGASSPPPQAEQKKAVVIAQAGDATTLHANMLNDTPTRNIHLNLFDTLVLLMPDGTVKPVLAESWQNPDALTWIFKIRKGVKFHNGYDLTAEDIKYSLERVLDPKNKSPRASTWRAVATMEVPDPHTLVIKTSEPYPLILSRFSGSFNVISKQYYEDVGEEKAGANPVGSGPFKFKEWKKDQELVLEAFDGYWGGRPKIDKLTFRSVPEASTRIADLVTGKVHLATTINLEQAKDLEGQKGVKPVISKSTRIEFVVLDNQKPGPLQNQKVRQALNFAVDKDGLLKAFNGGEGEPVGQPVTRPMFGFNPAVAPYPFDPAKAMALLKEAGYPNGFDTPFDCAQSDKEVCEAVALQLSKVGVTAKLQVLDETVFSQKFNQRQIAPMFMSSWLGTTVDAEGTLTPRLLSSSRNSFFTDKAVDDQIKAGAATVVPEERKKTYLPLMAELKEKAPWLYLFQDIDIYGASQKLDGWTPRPDSYIFMKEADLRP